MAQTMGRIRVSLKAEPLTEPTEQREEIPRVVRLLALAHRWHRMIDEGQVENQAEVARRAGLTRTRVSQIMELRWLPPLAQEEILARQAVAGSERAWRSADIYWPGQPQIE